MAIHFPIRKATAEDVPELVRLAKALAAYEKLTHQFIASEEQFTTFGFGKNPYFESILAEDSSGKAVGFALYFFKFSTFTGTPSLHLEDLFVEPDMRGNKIGLRLLAHLAEIAVQRNCARMEWNVLDWNEPAINFYKSLGAYSMDDWLTYRIDGDPLKELAQRDKGN